MSVSDWFKTISYISPIVMLIGITIGVFFYRNLFRNARIVHLYIICSLAVELISRILPYFLSMKRNLFMIPIWASIELILFYYLFKNELKGKTAAFIKSFVVLSFGVLLYEITILMLDFTPGSYSYIGKLFCNFSIVLITLNSIKKGLEDITSSSLNFLFNGITLGFYLLNLIIFVSINFLTGASLRIVTVFWLFNMFTTVAYQIFLSYFLWQNGKTQKYSRFG